jgi:hypothetical protein
MEPVQYLLIGEVSDRLWVVGQSSRDWWMRTKMRSEIVQEGPVDDDLRDWHERVRTVANWLDKSFPTSVIRKPVSRGYTIPLCGTSLANQHSSPYFVALYFFKRPSRGFQEAFKVFIQIFVCFSQGMGFV